MGTVASNSALFTTSDAYRRSARRLRSRYWNDPARLHEALCELVQSIDRPGVTVVERSATCKQSPTPDPIEMHRLRTDRFRRLVSATIDGEILRYDQRRQLLKVAAIEGIDRFEANLLIAQAQHRIGGSVFVGQESKRRSSTIIGMGVALLTQLAILAGAWLLLA